MLLLTIVSFIFVLSVVVFVHEMGHFLVARFFGVKVDAFSIGFGPEITGWTAKNGVRWRVAWIPLGGYVKFAGDEGAASMPSKEKLAQVRAEGGDLADYFHFKPLYQRALVVFAGPFANFLLSTVIFAALAVILGLQVTPPRVDAVREGTPAARAGFVEGDIITRVQDRGVSRFQDVRETIYLNPGNELSFTVERGASPRSLSATPEPREANMAGGTQTVGYLGIYPRAEMAVLGAITPDGPAARAGFQEGDWVLEVNGARVITFMDLVMLIQASANEPLEVLFDREGRTMTVTVTPEPVEIETGDGMRVIGRIGAGKGIREGDFVRRHLGPVSAVGHGSAETVSIITQTLGYIGGIFAGTQSADQLGGPLRIAQISGQAASISFEALIRLVAILSVSIGLINLFPVPMLDGGHLVFYAYEAVAGKPLGEGAQEVAFRIGLALVLGLMVFALWNDVSQMISQ